MPINPQGILLRYRWQKISIALGILVVVLLGGYYLLVGTAMTFFSDPFVYKWQSPTQATDYAIFLLEGFQDRGLTLFVEDNQFNSTRPRWIGRLDWTRVSRFHDAVWSRDGSVIAVRVTVYADSRPVRFGYAYDFREHRVIAPPWETTYSNNITPIGNWNSHAAIIQSLLDSHGGIDPKTLDFEMIKQLGHTISFGQIPRDASK